MVKFNQEEFELFSRVIQKRVKVKDIRGEAGVGLHAIVSVAEALGETKKITPNSRVAPRIYYLILKEYKPERLREILHQAKTQSASGAPAASPSAPTVKPEKKQAPPETSDRAEPSEKEKPSAPTEAPLKETPAKASPPPKASGEKTKKKRSRLKEELAKLKEKEKEPARSKPAPSPSVPQTATPSSPEESRTPPTPVKEETTEKPAAKVDAPAPSDKPAPQPSLTQARIRKETEKLTGPVRTGETIDLSKFKPKPKPAAKDQLSKERARQQARKEKRTRIRPVASSDAPTPTAWTQSSSTDRQKSKQRSGPVWHTRGGGRPHRPMGGGRKRKRKQDKAHQHERHPERLEQAQERKIEVSRFITVAELAKLMNVDPSEILTRLFELGTIATINERLEEETIKLVGEEMGYEIEFVDVIKEEELEEPDNEARLQPRPPIVTVMGHVDHGKTSLLDYIRNTRVAAKEAGGITQKIGAYMVTLPEGQRITFIDTPGHEAFTTMRARGAKVTDIAVIVIAADDGIMPRTEEAISHAQAAGVDIIFALNKVDKPNANPDRVRQQLAEKGFLVEDWGGDYPAIEVSAKTGQGIDELLEHIVMLAELKDLKADPEKRGVGVVLESSIERGRGYVAHVLVLRGKIKKGDPVLVGPNFGRVRAMFDEFGRQMAQAGPSTPMQLIGLDGGPPTGEMLYVTPDEQTARNIAKKRQQIKREQERRAQRHITLEELGERIAKGDFQQLNIIVRADSEGSVDALTAALQKLSTDSLEVNIIHKGVGEINESDVLLASASSGLIIGFNVRPSTKARQQAEAQKIQIRTYSVIFDVIDDIKEAIKGMLKPRTEEVVLGTAEVKEIFPIRSVGTVAGCLVTTGKVTNKARARVVRNGIVVQDTRIASLKHYKDEVKEIDAGKECGILLEKFNDIKPGDVIEAYEEQQVSTE